MHHANLFIKLMTEVDVIIMAIKSTGLRLTLSIMRLSKLQSMTSLRELGSSDLRKRFFPVQSTPSSACACLSSFLCCFLSFRFCLYINKWELKHVLNKRLSAGTAWPCNNRENSFTMRFITLNAYLQGNLSWLYNFFKSNIIKTKLK